MNNGASDPSPVGGAIQVHQAAARPAGGWLVTGPDTAVGAVPPAQAHHSATPVWAALRYKWTMALVFLAIAVPAVAAIWLTVKPQYHARAEIRVRPIIPRLVFKTDENGAIPLYDSYMNTQIAILRSPTVLQRVLEQQDIRQTRWFTDPGGPFGRPLPHIERLGDALEVRPRPRTEIIDVSFTARRPKDAEAIVNAVLDQYMAHNRYMVDETEDRMYQQLKNEYASLEAQISGGENVVALLRKELGTGEPDELVARKRIRVDETEAQLKSILQRLTLLEAQKRYLQRGRIVDEASMLERERLRFVRFIESLPLAARVDLDRRLEAERVALDKRAGECLQLVNAAPQSDASAPAASQPAMAPLRQALAGGGDGVATDTAADPADLTREVAEARLEVLQTQIEAIDWQRQELALLLSGSPEAVEAVASAPAPQFQDDPEWRRLDLDVRNAQHAYDLAAKSYQPSHPRMQALASTLEFAIALRQAKEAQLAQQHADPLAPQDEPQESSGAGPLAASERPIGMDYQNRLIAIDAELALLRHQEQLVAEDLKRQGQDFEQTFASARTLDKEELALDHKRQLFQAVRERLDQKAMERDVPGSIEVLNRAFAPSSPSKDRRKVFTAMVMFLAAGASFGAAYLRACRVQEVLAADDLPVQLRAPFLGDLPLMPVPASETSDLTTALMAERVRMVRTALLNRLACGPGHPASTLLITSAQGGAGKSTVSAMLGRSFAECGKRVLLVDADMRRAGLSEHLGLLDRTGLADSLVGSAGPREAVCSTTTPRLSVVPAGRQRGGGEMEMMANGVFEGLLADWKRDFDVILFDSPPILPVADARILAGRVDGTVMIVRQDSCLRSDVIEALACLGSSGGKLLGTIFIGERRRGHGYGYSYHYNYNYSPTAPEGSPGAPT
ncbi:MAG: polysaccharide biosynthesis tyrosine autokinase [Planctomycetes bacterium]|nr:polysaccharide biosynthesis tyrosine autokinase [Planctomycetota bacterium]